LPKVLYRFVFFHRVESDYHHW